MVKKGQSTDVVRHLQTLFGAGAIGGQTDGQFLECFAAGPPGAAEAAFAILVERHGPMVLRVCRGVLGDPHEAEDAFQATFLVLVRKARALWVRDSLGPWLHAVALRVADKLKTGHARRRTTERRWTEMAAGRFDEGGWDDLGPILHEEVGRLPEKYRAPTVLCYLEGLTHEMAAHHLGWPVGTVRGRLARARDLLRRRLTRRGLAPTAGLLTAGLSAKATPAAPVPAVLVESTLRAAMRFAAGQAAGTVSSSVIILTLGVSKAMRISELKAVTMGLLAIGVILVGAGLGLARAANGPPVVDGPGSGAATREAPDSLGWKPPEDLLRRARRAIDEVRDHEVKRQLLLELAMVQAEAGDRAAALAACGEVLRTAEVMTDLYQPESTETFDRSRALGSIAEAKAALGDVEGAVATAKAIGNSPEMARKRELDRIYQKEAGNRTFVEVAGTLPVGFLAEAVKISKIVAVQQTFLDHTLRGLPTALAKAGRTLDAIDLAEALKHEGRVVEPEYLREVVIARAKAGDVAGALRTARTMPDMRSRVEAMVGRFFHGHIEFGGQDGVAQLQVKAGDRAGAEATVREALDLLAKAGDPVWVAHALTSIARIQAAIGDLPAAIRTAESIGDPAARDSARVGIAVALAQEGRWEAALAQADVIKDVAAKTAALIQFALARGRAKDLGGAREAFDRAIEVAQGLDATKQAYAMRHIAWRQAEAGDTDGAFRTHDRFFKTLFNPNSITSIRADDRALVGIAHMQAKSGDAEGARRTLERLKANLDYDYDVSEALGSTAEFQVASGDGEAALRWAEALDSPRAKARSLMGIARGLRPGVGRR